MYDQHYAAIAAEALPILSAHPIIGPLLVSIPPELREAQQRDGHERMRLAVNGDFGPYEQNIRSQGVMYARMGIRFKEWYAITRAFARGMTPRLVSAYGAEPERLSEALLAMQDFLDAAMALLAESYLEEKEAVVRESEERLAATLDSIGDGVIATDTQGRVVRMNPVAEALTGWTLDDARGRALDEVFVIRAEGTDEPMESPAVRVLRDGVVVGLANHTELVARGGTRVPIADSGAPIRDANGELTGVVLVFRDVTEAHQHAEARTRSRVLEAENARVLEASRMKSEFLANMSHELRTPLNAIIGFTELIHDGDVRPEMPEYKAFLGDVLASARHLLKLINDVLDLSKVEAGKLDFHPEPIDLEQLVHEVVAILRTPATMRGVNVGVSVDLEVREVTADPARLKQVLYNYLSNALKFTRERGRVYVRVLPEGPRDFRLEVEDSGIGIAPDDLGRLFVEFQQLDAGAAKRHGGTGLGLALTRRLVEAQHGAVGVRSEPGVGSVFHAVLPRDARVGEALPPSRAYPGARSLSPVVLVVEDDQRDQSALVQALTAEGYAVETASTGAQACRMAQERTYAAVTLDLVLPDMSGLDVLRQLRADARHQGVPVLVVTTVAEPGAVAGFAVHDILPKPLEASALLASLRRAGVTVDRRGDVLVVDDDAGSLRLMAATLAQLGYQATCAQRPEEGLRFAAEEAPLAVVLDLLMPGMDGFAFLRELRRLPQCRQTPVIVWTVKDLTSQEYSALHAAAAEVVKKGRPSNKEVLEELRTFLPPPPPGSEGEQA